MDALLGSLRLTKNVSFASFSVSPLVMTVIVFVVSPGAKASAPSALT